MLRAWKLKPSGMQRTLRSVKFRGEDEIDPRTTNLFRRLIELRKRKSGDALDDDLRSTGYKVIANSGSKPRSIALSGMEGIATSPRLHS